MPEEQRAAWNGKPYPPSSAPSRRTAADEQFGDTVVVDGFLSVLTLGFVLSAFAWVGFLAYVSWTDLHQGVQPTEMSTCDRP